MAKVETIRSGMPIMAISSHLQKIEQLAVSPKEEELVRVHSQMEMMVSKVIARATEQLAVHIPHPRDGEVMSQASTSITGIIQL